MKGWETLSFHKANPGITVSSVSVPVSGPMEAVSASGAVSAPGEGVWIWQ